jgi:hypothetical protein
MPHFPKKEAAITALARQMIAGFWAHPGDFPNISIGELNARLNHYLIRRKSWSQAVAKRKLATEIKQASFKRLKEIMKNCLKKSEVDVAGSPDKLAEIGWGPLKIPQSIEKPGQPDNLRSVNLGRDKVTLKWDSPANGGAVRNYIIQWRCQQKADGKFDSWKLTATAFQNYVTLTNQSQKSTLEYRVKAVNISGESISSNTITVVL